MFGEDQTTLDAIKKEKEAKILLIILFSPILQACT